MKENNYKILPLSNFDILSSYARASRTPKNLHCTIMKAEQSKHVTKLKIDREVTYMNNVRYHSFLYQVTADTPIQVLLLPINNVSG
jgi:hypothetical protein